MQSGTESSSRAIRLSEKSMPNHVEPVDRIWEKLKHRSEQIDYGTLCCEIMVHGGIIKQIDIIRTKERFRAD